ncbi:MAG TPA: hypothetical protein VJM32_02920 [Candidatus Saccharimonadales bacterium]|nr:hypothetical protein [Candidatus Saccharimonadales bacterium]
MSKTARIWNLLAQNEQPSKGLIVECLKELAQTAKELPASEREAKGDYSDASIKFPQTPGEDMASDISSILAQQEWIDAESEPEFEEIGSIAGSLETNVTDAALWSQLLEKN